MPQIVQSVIELKQILLAKGGSLVIHKPLNHPVSASWIDINEEIQIALLSILSGLDIITETAKVIRQPIEHD